MRLEIDNKQKLDIFVSLFNILKNWGSFIIIHFEKDHVYIQSMDKSHICLANIHISSAWFSQYVNICSTKIVVESTNFAMLMNCALKHDKTVIKFDETIDPDKINIDCLNSKEHKGCFDHFFELSLVDMDEDNFEIPEVEYDIEFFIDSKKVVELVTELNAFGSNLNIIANADLLEFKASGDSGKLTVNIPIDDLEEYTISEDTNLSLTYSLSHLSKLCVSNKLSNNIYIAMSNDFPMLLKYNLGDESNVSFYIAPKISD